MLKTILSVSGKPGLYKLVSSSKNMIIVDSLVDKKRLPIYSRDKVVSLGDIAMYTMENEEPLKNILSTIKKKENGGKASVAPNAKPEELFAYLNEILPGFDKDRVYPTDVKKLINWYNILIEAEVDFEAEESVAEMEDAEMEETVVSEESAKTPISSKTKSNRVKTSSPKVSSEAKVSQRSTRKKV